MATLLTEIIEGQDLANTTTTYYTVGTGERTTVTKLTLCNHSASTQTVDVYFVPSGDSAAGANQIVDERGISAGETLDISVARHTLPAGTTIQASASAATSVSIRASGQRVT